MSPFKNALRCIVLLSVLSGISSCANKNSEQSPNPEPAVTTPKQGDGRGVVKFISPSGKSLELDHNNIPGLMDAMSMNYIVEDSTLLKGIAVGDSVMFTLKEREKADYVVSAITPIGKPTKKP